MSSDARNLESCLVSDLQSVHRWVDVNKLKLNVKKTKLYTSNGQEEEGAGVGAGACESSRST